MVDRRRANTNWLVADEKGDCYSVEHAQLAVLMDIRDELNRLNGLLHCANFTDMPWTLKAIRANTAKPRKKAAPKRRAA